MIRKTQIYYHVRKINMTSAISSLSNFSFTTSAKLLLRKCFFFTFFKTFILILHCWCLKYRSVTCDYNVCQTSSVFITHFDLWVGWVTFDYNVGQTGTVFITHFDLWVGSVTFDNNVGQTGTVFITHFDLWWHFITLFSKLQNLAENVLFHRKYMS